MTYHHRNHNVALTNDEIYRLAPSVFATQAHDSRTERFRPIPTIQIVESLRKEGFEVVSAAQCRTRDDSKREFTKHLLRLRHMNELSLATLNEARKDSHGEIVLKNANDGTASYQLMSGVFRIVCTNGLIAASELFDAIRVKHSGSLESVASKVIEGTYQVVDETARVLEHRDHWRTINMNRDAQIAFADAAHVVRFGDSEGNVDTPIKSNQLLIPRRSEDAGDSLWQVFNRVQENSIKGGKHLRAYNSKTHRMTSIREVKSLDNDVRINKALWRLADYFAKAA
jgi:hypothetical protein